jgi:hypothetical protein
VPEVVPGVVLEGVLDVVAAVLDVVATALDGAVVFDVVFVPDEDDSVAIGVLGVLDVPGVPGVLDVLSLQPANTSKAHTIDRHRELNGAG